MTGSDPGGFTVRDLAAFEGEGRCCELIGGAVVVTPAPDELHAVVVPRLADLLAPACPHDHQVFARVALDLPGGYHVRPDLVVVPDDCVRDGRLQGTPLLVVEVVSPGSKVNDLVTKRAVYAKAGIPAYWVVNPADGALLALRLEDDAASYEEYADTVEGVGFHWPLKVAFSVADLTRPG